MKALLEKLEHKAEQWVNSLDAQLQQPIVQVVTGEVFTHSGVTIDQMAGEPESIEPPVPPPGLPQANTSGNTSRRPSILQGAKALPNP